MKSITYNLLNILYVLALVTLLLFPPDVHASSTTTASYVTVNLQVESTDSTLFDAELDVSACSPTASSTPSVNGYCAVKQSGLDNTWAVFGDDLFLESIGGVANDFSNNLFWLWFTDLDLGEIALNKHLLSDGEKLLLTIEKLPMKLEVSTTTPKVGSSTTVSILEFGFDSSFNGVWSPSASSTLHIEKNGTTISVDVDGEHQIVPDSPTSFSVFATKDGFLDTSKVTFFPVSVSSSTEETIPTEDGDNSTSTDSSLSEPPVSPGGGSSQSRKFDVGEAVEFLESFQEDDGYFGQSVYSDWVALAINVGSSGNVVGEVKKYLENDSPKLNSVTDYERRAMVLMAYGINPYSGTDIDYIQEIVNHFDGQQIGDENLVNDDIFAIFPLIKSGFDSGDEVLIKITEFILSKQENNGSWNNSVDITAAAIQALSLLTETFEIETSLSDARGYLVSKQKKDGGFGSSFSTSWALQAIVALDENFSDWKLGGKNPNNYLYSLQQSDGGIESMSENDGTRIWATAYAVPAILSMTWGGILKSFSYEKIVLTQDLEDNQGGTERSVRDISTSTVGTEISDFESEGNVLGITTTNTDIVDDYEARSNSFSSFNNSPIDMELDAQAIRSEPNITDLHRVADGGDVFGDVEANFPDDSNDRRKILLIFVGILGILFITMVFMWRHNKRI